jgi:hypothetical protein
MFADGLVPANSFAEYAPEANPETKLALNANHEMADAGSRGADHCRKRLLAYGNWCDRWTVFLPLIRQKQERRAIGRFRPEDANLAGLIRQGLTKLSERLDSLEH